MDIKIFYKVLLFYISMYPYYINLNNIPENLKVSEEKIKIPADPPLTPTQIFEQIDTRQLSNDDREQLKQIVISTLESIQIILAMGKNTLRR